MIFFSASRVEPNSPRYHLQLRETYIIATGVPGIDWETGPKRSYGDEAVQSFDPQSAATPDEYLHGAVFVRPFPWNPATREAFMGPTEA